MDALGDIVARDRRSDDPALVAPRGNRHYDYRRFCNTAWKTGNYWRRRGVHEGATVAVADAPAPETVFSFLGAALLGAKTRFGTTDASVGDDDFDARLVVAPRDEIGDYDVPPGTQRVAYGGPPDDPSVAHFERDVWSENPAFPETPIDPETVAIVAGDNALSHAEVLAAARRVADDWELAPGDEVAVRAPFSVAGTAVAGVVAPLLAGAVVLLPDDDATGDFAVAQGGAPEEGGVVVPPTFGWTNYPGAKVGV
ncbi:hypothetical protein [Halorussus sp. MSC15.2]|uniref:hypothetical protein n=1 Tax=Halorussus sp. MSC15.2 TaxID=2283638 RepID=UPI0013D2B075|nr:hypothetical protein [Halorussus sp. MSC15.2]NEU57433.1 hypothetical protein [Halorussus sp. MSC15.2]